MTMATYAIGDVHGCYRELRRLLEKLPIDWDKDRLWMVGDLVNRGPDSTKVLRWARRTSKEMGNRFQTVLGNHELRLIAMDQGWLRPRASDTARDVLRSKHRKQLMRWLSKQPLLYRRGNRILVHAGLWPHWTPREAESWATDVHKVLARKRRRARQLLDPSVEMCDMNRSTAELNAALEAFTRLRSCTRKGKICSFSGPLHKLPKGCIPWFEFPGRRSQGVTVVCGHWAALGLRVQKGLVALDSGCCWGGSLTAVRLGKGTVYEQSAL